MTDPARLVDERIDQLLDKADPRRSPVEEFRGVQYDLGLAWVHFPEGRGGLGRGAHLAGPRGRPAPSGRSPAG